MNASEFSIETNHYVQGYIKYADAKAGAVATFSTALAAAVTTGLSKTQGVKVPEHDQWWWCLIILSFLVLVLLVGAILHALAALVPRTPDAGRSLHSFPDISKMTQEEYAAGMAGLSEEVADRDLAVHTWVLSCIASEKFLHIKTSIGWLKVAVVGSALLTGVNLILLC